MSSSVTGFIRPGYSSRVQQPNTSNLFVTRQRFLGVLGFTPNGITVPEQRFYFIEAFTPRNNIGVAEQNIYVVQSPVASFSATVGEQSLLLVTAPSSQASLAVGEQHMYVVVTL